MAPAGSNRPNASAHGRPCDTCRRRKVRCISVAPDACAMCKKMGSTCTYFEKPAPRARKTTDGPTANSLKASVSKNMVSKPSQGFLPSKIVVPPLEPPPENFQNDELLDESIPPVVPRGYQSYTLLGPSGDQDPFLLQYYKYSEDTETASFIKHCLRRVSADPDLPVQFMAFNDERGRRVEQERVDQLKRIEKLAGEFESQLLALFFRFVHPTYPIVDKVIFYRDYYYNKESMNPGLLAGLLALSCVWWKYDSVLCINSIPPGLSNELYKECEISVDREINYPTLSTVQALLLLLQRRLLMDQVAETYSVTVDAGRLVTVAHNIGLHLDCSSWNIPPSSKRFRKRLWATIYIVEKWTTANCGRPSLLSPINTNNDLFDSEDPSDQLFVYMGRITAILDEIMQEFYSVRHAQQMHADPTATHNNLDKYFRAVAAFRDTLPDEVRDMSYAEPGDFAKNGSLHLSILTAEVFLHRIRLRPISMELPQYPKYRAEAEECVHRILKFTQEITHSHLHAFWFSTTRLNFSILAHFIFFFHITSPAAEELKQTREVLRKWLWGLRVLSQGWEEGTGLAMLRIDTVFWMSKDLFATGGDAVLGRTNLPTPPPGARGVSSARAKSDVPEPLPVLQEEPPTPHNENLSHISDGNSLNGLLEEYVDEKMLLLNEDIMSQQEQIDQFMSKEIPTDLADAYADYFDIEEDTDIMLTQDLHELLSVPQELLN